MNPRELTVAWLIAFGLLAVLTIVPVMIVDRAARSQRAEVFMIGTSLMAYAVPASGSGPTSLFDDGRSHIRIAARRMSEADLLAQLEQAIDQRPKLVLLEINPLLFDFADQAHQRPCDGVSYSLRTHLGAALRLVPEAYRQLSGRPLAYFISGEPDNLAQVRLMDPATVRQNYPLALRSPCDEPRLAAAVTRAKAQATRVVLVLPPRSPHSTKLLGTPLTARLKQRARILAARLGVELLEPAGDWPDNEFADSAHLNQAGRDHFLGDLRRWAVAAQ